MVEDDDRDAAAVTYGPGQPGTVPLPFDQDLQPPGRPEPSFKANNRPDVILLDLGLADANGLEVVERIRVQAPGIPLVVLTGQEDEGMASAPCAKARKTTCSYD